MLGHRVGEMDRRERERAALSPNPGRRSGCQLREQEQLLLCHSEMVSAFHFYMEGKPLSFLSGFESKHMQTNLKQIVFTEV